LTTPTNNKIWTWSSWVKKSFVTSDKYLVTANGTTAYEFIKLSNSSSDNFEYAYWNGSAFAYQIRSTLVLRDPSAWYHIVVSVDTTQATAANRVKLYVNNVEITSFSISSYPAQNTNTQINSAIATRIGGGFAGNYFDGYLTEVNFIDGQALTPSSFGETDSNTGVWKPKAFSGTYGTNGFFLPFKTASQWSGFFDGTGDYVNVSGTGDAINFGTSDFTIEGWVYVTSLATNFNILDTCPTSNATPTNRILLRVLTNGTLQYATYQATTILIASSASAVTTNLWNHVALVKSSGSTKLYLNGTQVGSTYADSLNYPLQTNRPILVGDGYNSSALGTGYLSNLRIVKGTAVYTANFTPPTSQLTAITNTSLLTCQSSTFIDNSPNNYTITVTGDSRPQQFSPFTLDITDDHSGQGNNWQPNNLDLRTTGAGADILVDTPTNYGSDTGVGGEVRGNYCTLNPTDSSGGTISNGNLDVVTLTTGSGTTRGTIGVSSGKWYWEGVITSGTGGMQIGIVATNVALPTYTAFTASGYAYSNSGNKENNSTATAYGASYTTNDVIGVALDMDAGTLVFYKNGASQGTAFSSLSGTFAPGVSDNSSTLSSTIVLNFGQRAFAYTAPSGFKALCTQNLPTPTIGATSTTQANDYFNIALWNGDGATSRAITGLSHAPNFVWIKKRTSGGTVNRDHVLYDIIRGTGANLRSNQTNAESTGNTDELKSFDSDGFTLGSGDNVNGATGTPPYVGWAWRANGAGGSNTAGTITSTVSANTTSGFSIVTYTGNGSTSPYPTVGHGLGITPKIYLVKRRDNIGNWVFWHTIVDNSLDFMYLNTTAANANSAIGTVPTSTVMTVGGADANASGSTYVAYCFAPVAGYSAFGSYTGNGSADGPFIYTGFKPRYLLTKESSASGQEWFIWDTARDTYNQMQNEIFPNSSAAENATGWTNQPFIDFTSNGFKLRSINTHINNSGSTFIYAAFAEHPFKYSLAR
jgi:hypothetical protein